MDDIKAAISTLSVDVLPQCSETISVHIIRE
jgi:hypothetical protein